MKTAIHAENLFYAYKNQPVLKDVSFGIKKGEFFIIIGPNGSGKTTLLKVISGIEKLQKGSVEILERSVRNYSRKSLAKAVAFVPQSVPTEFPFTVTEVILMGRAPHLGMLGLEQENDLKIAREAMNFTGVESLADRKIDQLSGGERQRVFIARAICQEPQIIVLDEPTASLDVAHQVRVMDLMEKLKKEKGVTIVMVSHDVNLAAMYADTLLLLKSGQIVHIGTPKAVLTFETLERAYGCTLLVDESPLGKVPRITPVPQKYMIFGPGRSNQKPPP